MLEGREIDQKHLFLATISASEATTCNSPIKSLLTLFSEIVFFSLVSCYEKLSFCFRSFAG